MEKILYKPGKGDYNLIMAYPAPESFALASLGYLWLFREADIYEGVNAIRASVDNIPGVKDIGAIAFSMSFDFDFLGVFKILEKLNIPFEVNNRDGSHPLIFAGGPVLTTNPGPYEAFFDFMIIGDGEDTFSRILQILKNNDKEQALELLSKIEGVYIPDKPVKKYTSKLSEVIYTPILSEKSYFKDTFVIEIARGCMNRCAFCTASYTNLPFRYYEYEKILEAIDLGLQYTNKIALLGAQISAHPQFEDIMEYLNQKMNSGMDIELGISSLRTDSVTPKMVQILVKGGQKHSTIAIEAASERLRRFINKNLNEEQIINAVKIARENGLKGLKIYSMIGIPSETEEDIREFLTLAEKLKQENKGFGLDFSFSTFVPKPQTPLQWAKREDTKSLEAKQKFLEKGLAKIGVKSKFSSIKWDFWQTVLSRGDKNLAEFLTAVYNHGENAGAFKKALKETGIDINKTIDGYDLTEELPWDIIANYPPKQLLINEYNRLLKRI